MLWNRCGSSGWLKEPERRVREESVGCQHLIARHQQPVSRDGHALRILQVVREMPMPARTGGHIRALGIASLLATFGEVHVIGIPSRFGHDQHRQSEIYRSSCSVAVPHRLRLAARMIGASWRLSPRHSWAIRQALSDFVPRDPFDVVVVEELYAVELALLNRLKPHAGRIIYSAHNIESEMAMPYRRVPAPIARPLMQLDVRAISARERKLLQRCHGILCVSETERDRLLARAGGMIAREHTAVIPNCPGIPPTEGLPWSRRAGMVLAGSFGWAPNRQGLEWFLDVVLPLIRRTSDVPVAVLTNLLQADMRRRLHSLGVTTWIGAEDQASIYGAARVALVPVLTGGGSRVRIVEALACGVRVVSTSKGAEGQPDDIRGRIAIADSPERFAAEAISALEGPPPGPCRVPTWSDFRAEIARVMPSAS